MKWSVWWMSVELKWECSSQAICIHHGCELNKNTATFNGDCLKNYTGRQTDRQIDRQILWHHKWGYADFFFQLNLLPPYSLQSKFESCRLEWSKLDLTFASLFLRQRPVSFFENCFSFWLILLFSKWQSWFFVIQSHFLSRQIKYMLTHAGFRCDLA